MKECPNCEIPLKYSGTNKEGWRTLYKCPQCGYTWGEEDEAKLQVLLIKNRLQKLIHDKKVLFNEIYKLKLDQDSEIVALMEQIK
jgi:transposase-like protein